MKSIVAASALLTLAACATVPLVAPPAPGPLTYKCTGRSGDVRYLRISPATFQVWHDSVWGENACNVPGDSCKVAADGKIAVHRVIMIMENKVRVDADFVYDLARGTEMQTSTVNGETTKPSYSTCTPFTS